MSSIGIETTEQFWRPRLSFGFQFLRCLSHCVAVVENHSVGDQVVVFDGLQLVLPDILLARLGAEVNPLGELVETFAFVLGGLNQAPEFGIADVVEQEDRANHAAEFSKGIVEFVLAARGAWCCASTSRAHQPQRPTLSLSCSTSTTYFHFAPHMPRLPMQSSPMSVLFRLPTLIHRCDQCGKVDGTRREII
nr:hypothetical protein [Thiocystis minor]